MPAAVPGMCASRCTLLDVASGGSATAPARATGPAAVNPAASKHSDIRVLARFSTTRPPRRVPLPHQLKVRWPIGFPVRAVLERLVRRYGCAVAHGATSRGVEFALDSFELADGRLVVAGRWFGVSGRRFVRPVLQADGQRRVIAVLDHKPWSAEEGAPWLAAFPDMGHAGPSRLQVAPDIAVELPAAGPGAGDGTPRPARLTRAAAEPAAAEPRAAAPKKRTSAGARKTAELEAERDAALAEVQALRGQKDTARAEADRLRAELDQARREAERLQGELGHARTDADRLRTELSHVRAEANTLSRRHEETQAKAEQLAADVAGLRTDAQRAVSEHAELERLRHAPQPSSSPYIAPRPMAFRDSEPGPDWTTRVLVAFCVVGVLLVLLQVLFGVL